MSVRMLQGSLLEKLSRLPQIAKGEARQNLRHQVNQQWHLLSTHDQNDLLLIF